MILLLSLACGGDEPAPKPTPASEPLRAPPEAPTTQPTLDLGSPSGGVAWRALDHLAEAKFTLNDDNRSSGTGTGRFELSGEWRPGASFGRLQTWQTDLPFSCPMPRPNYAPMGARLFRGTQEIPYLNGTVSEGSASASGVWQVDHGAIKLSVADDPRAWPEPPRLEVAEIAAAYGRRNFGTSGLSPGEFVRTSVAERVGGLEITRQGMLLPAPSEARFPLMVPAGAKLRFGLSILPDPILGVARGDGAELAVTVAGVEAWTGGIGAAETRAIEVDLGKWAGQTVDLAFRSSPRNGGDDDYLVLTSPYVHAKGARPPRRIVHIGIDTLRWDNLSAHGYARPVSAELDAWGAQSVLFDRAYAPAPRTRPSFRTALTGRYPLDGIHATNVAEVLAREGFATAGFVANVHLVPRFRFNAGFDEWHYENGARATTQIDRALTWLRAHEEEDAYVFVHLMDPHTFYNAEEPWKGKFEIAQRPKEVPAKFNRWAIISLMKRRKLTDEGRAWIRSAYDAEVAAATHEAARLLGAAETMAGRTLGVLHTDHGEEFWDHRGFEHNHTLFDELVHAVLWIHPPGGWQGAPRVQEPVGLIDLVPTLLDAVDVPVERRPPSDGRSLRAFLDAGRAGELPGLKADLADRPLAIGHLAFDRERWAVVTGPWKYILHTSSGREELYDLVADPGEADNRAETASPEQLTAVRAALSRATGWPVRDGWRIRLPVTVSETTLHFTGPIAGAGVIDPQAKLTTRTNFEWGEKAEVVAADVGTVTVSADRQTVTFVPGPSSFGQALYVICEAACPEGRLEMGGKGSPFATRDNLMGGTRYRVERGTVIVPLQTEAEAVAGSVDADHLEALEMLGYVEKDEAEE